MAAENKNNEAVVLDEVLTQFVNAYVQGERPDLDDFIERYPQYEAQIRRRVGGLREIDALFDSLVQSEGNDSVDTSTDHNLVGQKIEGFEIVEIIGRGGMGVVYLARDTRLKRSVAIKGMPPQWKKDSAARTRFRREAELLASLNHPNIAAIHDIIEQEDHSGYLVLEYVPGETLSKRMKRATLTMDEALSIGRQVAEAISAAHKKGIVHRDLKPGNIKITPEGQVKVLDFGLAKSFTREDLKREVTETQPGRVIGTPAYMSPEQARGKETDHRTDIWSFGCIMYQMLSGQLPFEGETATDTLARIIGREPDWLRLPKETPKHIHDLLHHCLDKDSDQRPGDITEAVNEITKTLDMPPVSFPVRLRRTAITISVTVIIVLSSVAGWFALTRKALPIRLVVLSFENLTSAEEYFAAGLMDEVATRLTGIHGLRVYKSKEKGAKQVAKDFGVDYILEGTVQRERPSDPNSRVIIRPQLIRATDDTHVWEDIYENNVSGVFRLLSDIDGQVAQALDITLPESDRQVLASKSTNNPAAYHYYVRGNEYSSRPYQDENSLIIAIKMYEKAVELDEGFALAYAKLSVAHCGMYWFRHDRSEERLQRAWEASEKALELDPELPEAHWARGVYYYWGDSDYARALDELNIAQPKNSELFAMIGYVQRAQGNHEQALTHLKKAFELNPLDYRLAYELGSIFRSKREYLEAEYYYEQAISLAPDEYFPYNLKAGLYLVWKGNTIDARKVIERASQYINIADEWRAVKQLFDLDVLDRKYEEALARLPLFSPSTDELTSLDVLRYAQIHEYRGDFASAEKYYNKARSILESQVEEYPNSRPGYHCNLGIAYAGLGLKEEAIRKGKKGEEIVINTKDSQSYFSAARDLATIYIKVGEFNAAIDQIEYMLSFPGSLSIPLLQLDPAWDPLRNHPRFQKLIEYGQ